MITNIDDLLNSRQSSHGDYVDKSKYIQHMKALTRSQEGWSELSATQMESLDNIFQKVGRIIFGDGSFKDHWDDISGYSQLISSEIENVDNSIHNVEVGVKEK